MKSTRLFVLLFASLFVCSVWAGKKSVQFNVMITDSKGKSTVEKRLKATSGVHSVKTNAKTGIVEISYDDSQTNIATLTGAFRSAGFYASPIGENCATKPGGCLNNTPTTTNTMR